MQFRSIQQFFFFNDTATTEIYTLSLHDALPISLVAVAGDREQPSAVLVEQQQLRVLVAEQRRQPVDGDPHEGVEVAAPRSEEHTSELQSRQYLVCRLLLEKKKKKIGRAHV